MNLFKNKIKSSISFIVIFALIFSFVGPITSRTVEAAEGVNHSVNIRIEGSNRTILGPREVDIDSLDLTTYPGIEKSFDELKPIHAIIKGLEDSGMDPKENLTIVSSSFGPYIGAVAGIKGAGWSYTVDNLAADLGVVEYKIRDGQDIVLYNMETYEGNAYSWFEEEAITVNQGEEFQLQLNASNPYDPTVAPDGVMEGATILVGENPYKKDGEIIKTDSQGKISLSLEEEGKYHISAVKKNDKDQNTISRPYASVEVKKTDSPENEDEIVPEDKEDEKENGKETDKEDEDEDEITKELYRAKDIDRAIEKTVDYYKKNNPQNPKGDWEAYVGLWGVDGMVDGVYDWETINQEIEADTSSNDTLTHAYSLLVKGKNPSDIWGGRNLLKELSGQQGKDGFFTNMGKHIFSMVLLDNAEEIGLDVGRWSEASRQKAIDALIKKQNSDGSFGSLAYLDNTGWSLIALSKYRDQENVGRAIDKALVFLKSKQTDNGGFDYNYGFEKGENSNSISAIIQGLVAIEEDLTLDGPWVKNGKTPVDALLRYQQEDGSFLWELGKTTTGPATKQAIITLSDLKTGKSTWHRLGEEINFSEPISKELENLIEEIDNIPETDKITLKDKAKIEEIYSKYLELSKEEQEQVINRNKLLQAVEMIEKLEKANGKDEDLEEDEDYTDEITTPMKDNEDETKVPIVGSGKNNLENSPKTGDEGVFISLALFIISLFTIIFINKKRKTN